MKRFMIPRVAHCAGGEHPRPSHGYRYEHYDPRWR